MWFIDIVIIIAVIFYVRFFIINSLRNKLLRRQTFYAAARALYFLPIFQQGLFLFCLSLIYVYTTCKGFFLMWEDMVFFNRIPEVDFLKFASLIGVGGLLLTCNFMLAKISMNSKMDMLSLVNKFAYLVCSVIMLRVIDLNLSLLYPNDGSFGDMVFYDEPSIIIAGALIYLIVLILPFITTGNSKNFRYLQLAVRIGITYFLLCFILATMGFIIYAVLKLTVSK